MAGQRSRVFDAARPAVEAAGLDLEDVEISAARKRSVVRVIVDSDDGVDLDTVADVSRRLGDAFDAADAMGQSPYVLEVTSPGVDRPLREPRHWRRAAGRLVTTTVAGRPVTGRIVAADDATVTLDTGGAPRQVGYDELGPGRVQIEFNPPSRSPHPLSGSGSPGSSAAS